MIRQTILALQVAVDYAPKAWGLGSWSYLPKALHWSIAFMVLSNSNHLLRIKWYHRWLARSTERQAALKCNHMRSQQVTE